MPTGYVLSYVLYFILIILLLIGIILNILQHWYVSYNARLISKLITVTHHSPESKVGFLSEEPTRPPSLSSNTQFLHDLSLDAASMS